MSPENLEFLDYMQEAIVFHSLDTKIIYANKTASELLGLSQSELENKDAFNIDWEFVDSEGNTLLIENYPVNIAIREKKGFKNYIIGKKSKIETLWFNVNTEIIFLEDGTIDYIMVSFTDISEIKKTNEELELYKQIVDNADTGVTVANMKEEDSPLILANPMFTKITGYEKEDVLGKNCRLLQAHDDHQEGRKQIRESIQKEIPCEVELKNYRKDGTLFYNLLNLTPIFDKNKKLRYYIGIQHDITKQKNLELQFKKLINTQDNLVILSNGKELEFVNDKFFEFFGYSDLKSFKYQYNSISEIFLPNKNFFYLKKDLENINWIEELLKLEPSQRVVSMVGKDFKVYAFSLSVNKFDDENYIVTFTDSSQAMLEKIELIQKTIHDNLTGALNREYFQQNFKRLIKEYSKDKSSLGIALLDIDHFKAVNDNYGHDIGDEVLIHFVKTVERYSRNDDILIRWGGEEFMMILKLSSEDSLDKALNHIRKVIEVENFPGVNNLTCSTGGTIYKNEEDIEATIKRADEALYNAKANGRNQVIIS